MGGTAGRRMLLACIALVHAGAACDTASAYTLTDWMRSWPNYYGAPSVAVAPTYAAPAAPLAAAPPAIILPPTAAPAAAPPAYTMPPAYAAPPPTYTPPAAGCGIAAPGCDSRVSPVYAAPAPVAAAPAHHCGGSCFGFLCRLFHHRTQYRTAWVQVPTTNYRPVVTCDPLTGAAVTAMQPCTTYTWEVRRVPVGGLFSATAYPPGAVAGTSGAEYTMAAPAGACATCPPTAGAAPYYAAPSMPPAGLPAPPAAPLATPIPDAGRGLAPSWGAPQGSADQAPQLTPGEAQGLQNLQRLPAVDPYPPIPLSDPSDPIPTRQSAEIRQPPIETRQRPAGGPRLDLTPVPDPDAAPNNSKPVPATPSRFDPRERTAGNLFRPIAAVAPIVWADQGRSATELRTARTEPAPSQSPAVDTGVWRVVQP